MYPVRAAIDGLRAKGGATLRQDSIRRYTRVNVKRPALSTVAFVRKHGIPWSSRRLFITDALPSILVPPFVFTGLLVGLWTYKCLMTILFQDKIIYMPYMPPFARSEKMGDYVSSCEPVQWQHMHIRSLDGTKIALCRGHIPSYSVSPDAVSQLKHVVICYFQGNGSSTPPRLPLLSNVLKSINNRSAPSAISVRYTIVALSYRGYWTSSGRASQRGIELDAQALLRWVQKTYGNDAQILLWGQSIGAGVAATAAAGYLSDQGQTIQSPVACLILETPFTGIKSMLLALYPQKWLPYRYLAPFLWNYWDAELALRRIVQAGESPDILLLPATRDEVVPPDEVEKLERTCHELGLPTERTDIAGALHTEATIRKDGQEAVAKFIVEKARPR